MNRDHIAELVRRQGVEPIRSAEDLSEPRMFDSDEQLNEFLADLASQRRTEHL